MMDKPVFIVNQARSGSTMLWKFFRLIPGVTAFFEPDHPELLQGVRFGYGPHERHYGVKSYFDEYHHLDGLVRYYKPSFALRRFYVAETESYDDFKEYILYLLRSARGINVLKFNRCSFRIGWLRKNFPDARVVHFHRNVRDQWRSSLRQYVGDVYQDLNADPSSLRTSCDNLISVFPFLSVTMVRHPYQRCYFLWRLAKIFGESYSDVSISYDEWIRRPREEMKALLEKLHIQADLEDLVKRNPIVKVESTLTNREGLSDSGFAELEGECEAVLKEYGITVEFKAKDFESLRMTTAKYRGEELRALEGATRQLQLMDEESCQRLMQVYEKENVIKELVREVEVLRKASEERLRLINELTTEIEELREEITRIQRRH